MHRGAGRGRLEECEIEHHWGLKGKRWRILIVKSINQTFVQRETYVTACQTTFAAVAQCFSMD